MRQFSANLGFLWTDRALPAAIRAAKSAGFDAVECHWPYREDPADVRQALEDTGLTMLGLNTARGDVAGGETGLSALPGRVSEAQAAIDEALEYAMTIGTPNILAVRADVDDDVVYQITKTIFEELEYLHGLHSTTRQISKTPVQGAVNGMSMFITSLRKCGRRPPRRGAVRC